MRRTHPVVLGRPTAAIGLVAVLLATAGCTDGSTDGTGPDGDDTAAVTVLSDAEAAEAQVSLDNLGGQFREAEVDGSASGAAGFGCLAVLDGLDELQPEAKAESNYEFADGSGLPAVQTTVESFATTAEAEEAVAGFRDGLAGCDAVDDTDEDGTRIVLDVTTDEDRSTEDVDEQVTFSAAGTATADGQKVRLGVWFSLVRVDNNLTWVGLSEIQPVEGAGVDEYIEIATDRLVAVASGDDPEDVVATPVAETVV